MSLKTRSAMASLINSWVGKKESDGSHKEIIDIYNSCPKDKLPRGLKMQYNWAWCAATWSAAAIKLGYLDICPIEMSCGYLIEQAQKMGCWNEDDSYIPKIGDAVLYDWQDNGLKDNTGWPDHVGIVTFVNEKSGYFVVTEGNYDDSVKKRTVSINGRYIRGFITPSYDDEDDKGSDLLDRSPGKSINVVAHEVITGIWDNYPMRKTLLESFGYDYASVQKEVERILNGGAYKPSDSTDLNQPIGSRYETPCYAQFASDKISGKYKTTDDLYMRVDAGTNKKAICVMPKGTQVQNYGYYSTFNGVDWYLVYCRMDRKSYTGFACSKYLKKIS